MSNHDDELLHRLTAADPEQGPQLDDDFDEAAVRTRVHDATAAPETSRSSGPRGRSRRRVLLVAAMVTMLLATVSVGYAVITHERALSITCISADPDHPDTSVVNAISGDPFRDCARHLTPADRQAYGVYTNDDGVIVVAPSLEAASAGVAAEVRPDPDLMLDQDPIELRMALEDVITGAHGCGDVEAVVRRARELVDRYGDDQTRVVEQGVRANPTGCASAVLDGSQVHVWAEEDREAPVNPVYTELLEAAQAIHAGIDSACLSGDEARRVVEDAVAGTQQEGVANVTVVDDPEADCARVHTNAYGMFEVTIYARSDGADGP